MKKTWTLVLSLFLLLSGCTTSMPKQEDKPTLLVSFYVLEDLSQQIVDDTMTITNLVPQGAEAHGYELSTQDMMMLQENPYLMIVGNGFETWLNDVSSLVQTKDKNILDVSTSVQPLYLTDGSVDSHIWTSPTNMKKIILEIESYVSAILPENSELYHANSQVMIQKIDDSIQKNIQRFEAKRTDTFVVQHPAFAYLAQEYLLNMVSIQAPGHEEEPDAARVSSVIELMIENKITTVFYSDEHDADLALAVAQDANANSQVLSTMEFLTQDQIDKGYTILDLMDENLKNLSEALQ